MIVAALAGVQVEEVVISLDEFRETHPLAKASQATLPALEVDGQLLTSSLAISKFLASHKSQLLGANAFEQAQVDQWLMLLRNDTQPLARTIAYQVFGHVKTDTTEHTYIYNLLKDNLKFLNNAIKGKTFIVGSQLTIVDIYLTLIQLELQ